MATEHLDTDDHRAFRLKAREWMKGRLPPRRADEPFMDWENKDLIAADRRTQRALWDGGLAGITLPRAYGGLGLDKRYEDIFYEEAEPYRLGNRCAARRSARDRPGGLGWLSSGKVPAHP